MALVSIEEISSLTYLGLWQIEERVEQLSSEVPQAELLTAPYKNDARKLEKLATHRLLHEMTGDKALLIGHNAAGKPLLDDYQISLSHTKGYVALLLSQTKEVGVDIERANDRVQKVAGRIAADGEEAVFVQNASIGQLLAFWCMKEAAYKFFSDEQLVLAKIKIHPFESVAMGRTVAENLLTGTTVEMLFRVNADYVLAYTL